MIKLIIFDMDGVMIDTEPFHQQAFDAVFQMYDKILTVNDNNNLYVGISDLSAAQDMIIRFSLPISAEELVLRKQAVYRELIEGKITPQIGLIELLNSLHKNGFKKVIASSSLLKEIKIVITSLKIEKYLDNYFSAEQVKNGKPAPDLFLFAAEKMQTSPEECLVLEDAPSGIQAATAAGMKSFAIPSKETKGRDFSNATKILSSLTEVFDNVY